MAIKPEDCLKLLECESKRVREYEAYIDNILLRDYVNDNSRVDIIINNNNNYINYKIINAIIRLYENVGWEVKLINSEGGECLTFKKDKK